MVKQEKIKKNNLEVLDMGGGDNIKKSLNIS
jgi:hypothetical protein